MKEKSSLSRIVWNGMYSIQSVALFFLMLSVTFLVFIQVILRYVLHAPLMGIEELLLFPAIWLYMLGGASASWEGTHITCGVLTLYIKKPRSIALFHAVKGLVSLTVCFWLTYWAYGYFRYSLRVMKQSATLYIPLVLGESALFISLVLMSIYTIVEVRDYFKELVKAFKASE